MADTSEEIEIEIDQLRKSKRLNFKIPKPIPRFWRRRAGRMWAQWVCDTAKKRLADFFANRIDELWRAQRRAELRSLESMLREQVYVEANVRDVAQSWSPDGRRWTTGGIAWG